MPETRVAVIDDYASAARSAADWGALGAAVEFFEERLHGDRLTETLQPFDVVVAMRERTPFPRELFEALPDLSLLVTTGMRNAAIDLTAAAAAGVTVCGTRSSSHGPAELTFALILGLARGLVPEVESVRAGGWQSGVGRELHGARLGVVGLGRFGAVVAGYGKAFGMEVTAWSENLTVERVGEVGVELDSLAGLLTTSDFVTIHLRLSERTERLIGRAELASMKQGAYLVNTSRGPIVDEEALLWAVRDGPLAGAALDVFDEEPLPPGHPFRSEPSILATPHIGYVSEETFAAMYGDAVEDIAAWMAGEPVRVIT